MKIIKRDGRVVDFNSQKIIDAILAAFNSAEGEITEYAQLKAKNIADYIEEQTKVRVGENLTVEEIQDLVEKGLMSTKKKNVAKEYVLYRAERTRLRGNSTDTTIEEIVTNSNEYWKSENSNKNPQVVTTQRDYIAGAASTDLTRRKLLPLDIVTAHDLGIIHFHDSDYYAQNALTNCELVNLEDMLQNGTVINGMMIEKPHRILTAATIATQIILAVTSSTYGGCTISLTHLAPFVKESYDRYYTEAIADYKDVIKDKNKLTKKATEIADKRIKKEICDAVQTFNYQVNSMTNTNGQAPFLSVCMYLGETTEYKKELALLIEEFLKQRILGFKNTKGVYIAPTFPKLLYVLEEDNITEDAPYFYLTELAAECTSKRMVPDYISEKVMKELKNGDCFPCMGCRSFLSPDPSGNHQYYGRFNQGVVTINLPDLAFSSGGNYEKFWELFEERTELCHKALKLRHKRIAGITSDAAPILWQYGAFARLKPGESVHPLLHNDYSTLSLGYAGLYECVKYMTGYSHTKEGKEFGLQVMQKLNDKCNQWKAAENIGYSLYGSPIESTTYKFAKNLKKRFPKEWKEIGENRNYITNSYHVNVREKISAFDKLLIESEFQKLSSGGAVSYIEVPDMHQNLPAVIQLIQFIYHNIMYAEINCKIDYCQQCGYNGEIQIKGEAPHLFWECPNCGNQDQNTMNVERRTCGYLGGNYWNQGRTEEIKERVLHLDW